MPSRYEHLYPELFVDLDPMTVSLALQSIGTNHDGSERPRQDVADAVERGRQMLRRIEQRRAMLLTASLEPGPQPQTA